MDGPTTDLPDATVREIESFVAGWLGDERVPGASIAIVDGDDVVYADGFGARDLATNAPATPDTLYGVASVTKSFTALAVGMLAEEDALSLADPVCDHVPLYEDVPGDPVAIRDLLSHTSGMPSDGSAIALIARTAAEDPVAVPLSGREDFRRHLADAAADRATDRERFFYYNSGYTALGAVVEAASGRDFEAFVGDEILGPLGMDRSTFSRGAFAADDDAMTPYSRVGGRPEPVDFPFDDLIAAPGGLLTSVAELTRYLRLHMHGEGPDGVRPVDPALLDEMHDRHVVRGTRIDGADRAYGYGWGVSDFLDDTLVGHAGTLRVSSAYVGYLDDADLGVAVACTTTPDVHPRWIGRGALAIASGRDPRAAIPFFALRDALDAVTGEYASFRGIATATVERVGMTLRLAIQTALASRELPLVPDAADPDDLRFHTVSEDGHPTPVEFDRSGDGVDLFVERWRFRRR